MLVAAESTVRSGLRWSEISVSVNAELSVVIARLSDMSPRWHLGFPFQSFEVFVDGQLISGGPAPVMLIEGEISPRDRSSASVTVRVSIGAWFYYAILGVQAAGLASGLSSAETWQIAAGIWSVGAYIALMLFFTRLAAKRIQLGLVRVLASEASSTRHA